MKITALEESANFATLYVKKLFSKLKSHELFRKYHLNHDAYLTNKSLITSARVGGHDANTTNDVLSVLEFVFSSLTAASDEQSRASLIMRLSYWQESFVLCTSFIRRGVDHIGAALSTVAPPILSSTTSRGRSLTPTSMTTPTRMTPATRVTIKRRTTSVTRRKKSFRRSCPEHVLP
jgi:hypothetical protein